MKNSVKRLFEGSPTRFFDDIRAKLNEKTATIVESVASTVADTVFTEAKQADRDENHVVVDNKNIQSNIQNKKPEKIKNKKATSLGEEAEPLEELSKATLGRYAKKAASHATFHQAKSFEKYEKGDRQGAVDSGLKSKKRLEGTKKAVDKLVFKNEEIEPVDEALGAHTISTTRGGKNGKSFQTFVVNKKRVSKKGQQRKWADLIKKATPKETEWEKHIDKNKAN